LGKFAAYLCCEGRAYGGGTTRDHLIAARLGHNSEGVVPNEVLTRFTLILSHQNNSALNIINCIKLAVTQEVPLVLVTINVLNLNSCQA
jgi:hypothetical protein